MWQIYYMVSGEQDLRVERVASAAEMLTAVRDKYREAVAHVISPNGQQMNAAQAGLFSMLYEGKAQNVPAHPSAGMKRMLALKQVGLPKLPGISRAATAQAYAGQPSK